MHTNLDFKKLLDTQSHYSDKSLLNKMSFDFIYTSAKIEGNSYTRAEASVLFETRQSISNKSIEEAIMLLNIKEAFEYVLTYKPPINRLQYENFIKSYLKVFYQKRHKEM